MGQKSSKQLWIAGFCAGTAIGFFFLAAVLAYFAAVEESAVARMWLIVDGIAFVIAISLAFWLSTPQYDCDTKCEV